MNTKGETPKRALKSYVTTWSNTFTNLFFCVQSLQPTCSIDHLKLYNQQVEVPNPLPQASEAGSLSSNQLAVSQQSSVRWRPKGNHQHVHLIPWSFFRSIAIILREMFQKMEKSFLLLGVGPTSYGTFLQFVILFFSFCTWILMIMHETDFALGLNKWYRCEVHF